MLEILGKDLVLTYPPALALTAVSAQAMGAVINSHAAMYGPSEAAAFQALNAITLFSGSINFNDEQMSRSFTDQKTGTFYWLDTEIALYLSAPVMACYFFHDCWHMVQFKQDDGPAATLSDEINREVDAVARQVVVGGKLGVPQYVLDFLTKYGNDRAAIATRIGQGVNSCACRIGQG